MKTVLYLGLSVAGFVQSAKLAGIRRYAGARGWEVVAIPEDRAVPGTIQALLSELNPVGCIVECFGGGRPFLPPRLFGAVPAVWLDVPPGPLRRRATRFVAVDEDAVARTALREFAAAKPVSLAAVMCEPWTWARVRARAFRKQAVAAGARCRMFEARRGEAPEARAARLTSWIATLPRPCGLFAVNDGAANEVRAACRAARLHVPRDVSILGVDNHPSICETKEPTLSSIRLDFERMGYAAATLLDDAPPGRAAGDKIILVSPLMTIRRTSTSGRGRRERFVLDAVAIIRREACDGLTARALAARFNVSRNLFDLRFREAVGHSPLDEILHVRLERACTLLAHTDTAIGAIPALCGFQCDRTLDALFRSRFGMSMRDWRRKNALPWRRPLHKNSL